MYYLAIFNHHCILGLFSSVNKAQTVLEEYYKNGLRDIQKNNKLGWSNSGLFAKEIINGKYFGIPICEIVEIELDKETYITGF